MQSPRSDREQRVVNEPRAMGNDQATRSSDEGKQRATHEEGAISVKKESKKRENKGKRERARNLEMKVH